MTPYLFKGIQMIEPVKKTFKALGSVGGLVASTVDSVTSSTDILKEKIDSSVQEEKIEQAKNRILAKAQAIKEIVEVLHCTYSEAEQLLNKEMEKC